MAINDRVQNALTAWQIDTIQAANGITQELLAGVYADADERLLGLFAGLGTISSMTPKQTARVTDRIQKILRRQDDGVRASVAAYVDDLSAAELTVMEGLFERTFGRLGLPVRKTSAAGAAARARRNPMRGAKVSAWVSRLLRNDRERVTQSFLASARDGLDPAAAARATVGTRSLRFMDGARQVSRRGLGMMLQTLTSHTSAQARAMVYETNPDLIQIERWVSTLDGKTSAICRGLDGRKFQVGQGIYPPAHPHCRSNRIPVVPSLRAFPQTPEQDILPSSVLEQYDGKLPQVFTYERWLRERTPAFQRQVLGPTRWKLWNTGKIKLDRFTNDANRILTIPDLRRRTPGLFEEVGL